MSSGQQLQTWLADREAQRRTQAAIDAFGRGWDGGPIHRHFDDVMAALPEQSAEAVAEAASTLFADAGWLDSLIDGLTAQLRDDPFFDPPFRAINSAIHSGLVVYEDERLSIAAGVTTAAQLAAKKSASRGPSSIGFSGRMIVLKFVKAGNALVSFWEAPRIGEGFTAARAGQCAPTGERRLSDGDLLIVDGRHRSYVIEQADSNLLIVQAEITTGQAPVSVEYDSASRGFVGCSANGDGASRIQMITTLVRKLDCDGAFDAVAPFLDHQDFFVRWHVMKELLGIDLEAALPHLKRMAARDPHPDARRAARSVLDGLAAAPRTSKAA